MRDTPPFLVWIDKTEASKQPPKNRKEKCDWQEKKEMEEFGGKERNNSSSLDYHFTLHNPVHDLALIPDLM